MAKKDTKLENLAKTVHMLIEEIRLSETEGLDRIFMDVYSQQASMMTDSRQQGKVKHAFRDILGIVFFGVLAGNASLLCRKHTEIIVLHSKGTRNRLMKKFGIILPVRICRKTYVRKQDNTKARQRNLSYLQQQSADTGT